MRPVDYSKTARYGKTMAMDRAIKSNTSNPMQNREPQEVEALFYQQGVDNALKLGHLGLQKEMFEGNLAENKRQFDVSTKEGTRQFNANRDFSRDQFKYQRRQDNRAEIIAMMNVGTGIGFGYLQYKQNRKQITMNKMMMAIMKGRQ